MGNTERETAVLETDSTFSLDLVFDLLSNRRRRYALYYLADQSDGTATLEELVTGICVRESDHGDADHHRKRIQTTLQHAHLPRLEDAGVVEYDARSDTVRYWPQPTLEEWLDRSRNEERLE